MDGTKEIKTIQGEAQSNENIICGCKFSGRCETVMDYCNENNPNMIDINNGHFVKCFIYK